MKYFLSLCLLMTGCSQGVSPLTYEANLSPGPIRSLAITLASPESKAESLSEDSGSKIVDAIALEVSGSVQSLVKSDNISLISGFSVLYEKPLILAQRNERGSLFEVLVNVSEEGDYLINFQAASLAVDHFLVSIDDEPASTLFVSPSYSLSQYVSSSLVSVFLKPGPHKIKFTSNFSSDTNIKDISIEPED